ncbi:NEL-type E3 ubiquitin ligase domain-containing protein [Pseudomonas agarici]|uniref:NEL-type E3 ubiquitin ligase domain-containing protein n=1 Tax=Pseudomonas agarici TaxID=46677 RepID=UPI000A565BB9|nr:NEL-type E3 ubiquitin ligase domain-containing protein [Pseudomonas agarici]
MSAVTHFVPSVLSEQSYNEEVINTHAPPWLLAARPGDIVRLREDLRRSQLLKEQVSLWFKDLKSIEDFSAPLLENALHQRFGPGLDIHHGKLNVANRWPALPSSVGTGYFFPMTYTRRSLLEAALHNFEANERLPPLSHVSLDRNLTIAPEVTPQAFMEVVRRLDLGKLYQQHLCEFFHLSETQETLEEESDSDALRIQSTIMQQKKADMLVDAHIAYLKKDIDDAARQQVGRLIELNVTLVAEGSSMVANELQMLGVTLSGICLFTLQNTPPTEPVSMKDRVLVHIPNDPLTRFKLYASLDAFQMELRRRLWQPAYERFFSAFVSKRDLPGFLSRLRKLLTVETRGADGAVTRSLNPAADLQLKLMPLDDELFFHLYRQQILRLQADARYVAVPTEDVDQDAREALYLSLSGLGMTLLNLAAFVNPWLGLLMMGVAVGQLLSEVYEGYQDWQHGDRDEAITHMMSVAEDIATMVAMGVAMHWGSKALKGFFQRPSSFFDDLVPVRSNDGRYRLWQSDLGSYRHDVPDLADTALDHEGFYLEADAGEGHRYLDIAGEPYRAYWDQSMGAWRLRHPLREAAYEPLLEHNGSGAWRLAHEWPLQWHDPVYLFRRLGPDVRLLSDENIEHILLIHRLDESMLRWMHANDAKIPAPLLDSIQRFRLDNELSWLLAPAEAPAAATARLLDLKLQILPGLKNWPRDHTIMLIDSANKPLGEYGADLTTQPHRLMVRASDLEADGLRGIWNKLTIQDQQALLSPGASTEQVSALLEEVLRQQVREQRFAVFQRLYRLYCVTDVGLPMNFRQSFADLPNGVLRELLGQTSDVVKEQLDRRDRVPLSLVETANEGRREILLNHALDTGFLKSQGSLDNAKLQLLMAKTMNGWPSDVLWEIRHEHFDGSLLFKMGTDDLPRRRVLVRSARGYQVFDNEGLSLGRPLARPDALSGAVLSALRLSERSVMAIKLDGADLLHKRLMSNLVAHPRVLLEEELGLPARKPGYRSPAWRDGDTQGCLRVRRGIVYGSRRGLRRVTRLYPDLCEPEARNFLFSMGEDSALVKSQLEDLEDELRKLRSTLLDWRGEQATTRTHAWLGGIAESREQAASIIERCWRRQTPKTYDESGMVIGRSLSLAGLRVGSLPSLPSGINFDHVTELSLNSMGLDRIPESFLEHFPNLRKLELNNNRLEFPPSAIADMSQLRELYLQDNRITLSPGSVNVLSSLHNLEVLNLNGNFDVRLLDVSQMPHLRRLLLRSTGIDGLPAGLLTRVRLYEADLRDNRIENVPQGLYTAPSSINRRIILRNNPFTVDNQNLLAAYRERVGISFGIPDTELALDDYSARQRWLTDIADGERRDTLRDLWHDLRHEEGSEEFFLLLARLSGSAEYQKIRADLTRRVWEVLEAATKDTALRTELFDLAANPMTCVDSAARNFSHLEVRVLLARARVLASRSDEPTELLKLARGLFRLERIDEVARDHIRDLSDRPEATSSSPVDEVEVNLAYRVGLGRSLYLPGQPKEMVFRSIANVTEEQILAARNRIRQTEHMPALKTFIASRDFWIDYLKRKYQRDFIRFNKPFHDQEERLLNNSPLMPSDQYSRRLSILMETRIAEEKIFLEALTQHELDEHPASR